MSQGKSRPLATSFLLGFSVFLAVCGMWRLGFFQSYELGIYDHFVAWRADPHATDSRIVLVAIKEEDIRKYDFPLRDQILARLLGTIEQGHPCAIGLDLYRDLPEPRDGSELGSLNRVLEDNANIVCIFRFGNESQPFQIAPPVILAQSPDRVGFNDFSFDYKTVRRGFIYLPDSYQYSSLAWQLALLYLAPRGIGPGPGENGSVSLGKTNLPRFRSQDGGYINALDGGYQILMDFKGPQNLTPFSVDQVLKMTDTAVFRDKIVLIGSEAQSATDVFETPLNEQEPGLEVHAQLVDQFLRAALNGDRPTTFLSLPAEVIWILGWSMLATALGYFCRSTPAFGLAFTAALAGLFLIGWFAFLHDLWLLLVPPSLAVVLAAGGVKTYVAQLESKQRSVLMRLFSQHVSSDVAESVWERRDEYMDGNRPRAQKLVATILFTDVKDYSTVSEKLEPDVLMSWIDEYLGALGEHVAHNGGMINKFMGDAIMAVFGAPIPSTTDAEIRLDAIHAVQCALDMKKEINRLNAKWAAQGLPQASMRVGIHTGTVMGGLVGNADRLEYTMIGDVTNTAARLESVAKENTTAADGSCRILIGDPTFDLVKDCFDTEFVDRLQLKGQNKTTGVHRILGSIENSSDIPKK